VRNASVDVHPRRRLLQLAEVLAQSIGHEQRNVLVAAIATVSNGGRRWREDLIGPRVEPQLA
jgi:hypothetical protein